MYDSIIKKLKTNPITSTLLLLVALVGGIHATTDSVRNIASTIQEAFNPSISEFEGMWIIEGTEYTPKTYITLERIGDQLYGKTKIKYSAAQVISQYIKFESGIYNVRIDGKIIEFMTKRTYSKVWGDAPPKDEVIAKYTGELDNDIIKFAMSIQGGYTETVSAKRIPLKQGEIEMKKDFSDWE